MIFGEHTFGMFNDFTVSPAPAGTGQGVMIVEVANRDEILTRADVERLRDLCNEALS